NQIKEISNTIQNACILVQKSDSTFLADTLIIETCGNSWSSTDAVQLCGKTTQSIPVPDPNPLSVEICNWKDCKKGAVSFSVDDGSTACMTELEAKWFRGTYFLSGTATYSSSLWAKFESAYKKGHELATHTRSHWCISLPKTQFIQEMDSNIFDITSHTSADEEDLITHAYPCGFTTPEIKSIIKDPSLWNFISTRGYHLNDFEVPSPLDYYNLKSFNTPNFHDPPYDPPNYLDIISDVEENGKWANLVLHGQCTDQGSINALPSKNIWVDTIGNVVKYSYLRDNAKITNPVQTSTQIKFAISTSPQFTSQIYNQNLTVKIKLPTGKTVSSVTSNSIKVPFKQSQTSLQMTVPFPISDDIVINMQ
ncbi:MAG: polysaccharide deacetylase family protein, partial [Nanoarchaeota archaeon]|nr:polysaccharide deacetylase family protein [Nanoarchaeota archaeon]